MSKFKKHSCFLLLIGLLFSLYGCTEETWKKLLGDGLSSETIVKGLKEALNVGVENSVSNLAGKAPGTLGFFNDPTAKISLPAEAQATFNIIRTVQAISDSQVGSVILGALDMDVNLESTLTELINRAAEDAVPEAAEIFYSAITTISIEDGLGVLRGGNTAATEYLRNTTESDLTVAFGSPINVSLNSNDIKILGYTPVGAWNKMSGLNNQLVAIVAENQLAIQLAQQLGIISADVANTINSIQPVNTNLGQYVTGQALDKLFLKIANEETKIRTDARARVTPLLQQVFGSGDN